MVKMEKADRKLFENKGRFLIGIPKAFARSLSIEPGEILEIKLLKNKIEIIKKDI
jgi:hypothetical protein